MPSEARRHGEGMGRGRKETGDKERENRSSMGMPWKEPKSTFSHCCHIGEYPCVLVKDQGM